MARSRSWPLRRLLSAFATFPRCPRSSALTGEQSASPSAPPARAAGTVRNPGLRFSGVPGRGVETGLCGAYRSAIDGGHDARLWHVDRECLPAFFAGDLFALRILEGDRLPVFTVRAVGDPLIRGFAQQNARGSLLGLGLAGTDVGFGICVRGRRLSIRHGPDQRHHPAD